MNFANQFGINLPGIGQALEQQEQNALRKMIAERQLQAADEERAGRNAFAQFLGGDQSQMGAAMAYKPEAILGMQRERRAMDEKTREAMRTEAPVLGRLFANVNSPETYAQAVEGARQAGLSGVERLPQQFDPAIVGRIVQTAQAFAPEAGFELKEGADGVLYRVPKAGGQAQRVEGFTGRPRESDNVLVEVFDESSPTGTRMVQRSEAAGRPGKPPSNAMKITGYDTSGRPIIEIGGRGSPATNPSGLAGGTIGTLEGEAITAGNQIARLNNIAGSFKPEYLQFWTRAGMGWSSLKEKGGVGLTPQNRAELEDFTKFRRDAVANLNRTIKDITGAAMSVPEADRITKETPNAGTGIFDGDSPTEFKAKLDASIKSTRDALYRANWARAKGLDPLKTGIDLQDVPKLIDRRGREIEAIVRNGMPDADDQTVRSRVLQELGREFGIAK
jgi:hypothetical protein